MNTTVRVSSKRHISRQNVTSKSASKKLKIESNEGRFPSKKPQKLCFYLRKLSIHARKQCFYHLKALLLQSKSIALAPQKHSFSTPFPSVFHRKCSPQKRNHLTVSALLKMRENREFDRTSDLARKNRKETALPKITLSPRSPFYLHPAKSIHQKGIHTH